MTTELKKIPDVSCVEDQGAQTITVTVRTKGSRVLDVKKVHAAVMLTAAYRGLSQQRIVDKAAVMRGRKDGSVKTTEEMLTEKWEAVNEILDHLESGTDQWGMRVARVKQETDHGLTIRAMVEVTGKTFEEVNAFLDRRATGLGVSRTAVLDAIMATDARVSGKVAEYRAARSASVDVAGWEDELAAAE